jgi:hypothetical protein
MANAPLRLLQQKVHFDIVPDHVVVASFVVVTTQQDDAYHEEYLVDVDWVASNHC